MAEEDNAQPAAPLYDAAAEYEVTYQRRVTLGGARLPLMGVHFVKGATLNAIAEENGADAIATAVRR